MIISFLNQKGGAGKSSLARTVGTEYARNAWAVHVADMDSSQQTTTHWAKERQKQGLKPLFTVASYLDAKTALKAESVYDLLIIDGAAYADTQALEIAKQSDLTIIPTGITTDDLRASLSFAQELTLKGIKRNNILFVVTKVPDNGDKEAMQTRQSIKDWNFQVVKGWVTFKTGYGKAMDEGRTLTETRHATLNERADNITQAIIDYATKDNEKIAI